MWVAAHFDEAADGDGEVPVDILALGEVGEFAGPFADGGATPGDGAGAAGEEAGDGFEEGGFSGSVWADEGDAVSAGGGEVDVLDGEDLAVVHGETFHEEFVVVVVVGAAIVIVRFWVGVFHG